MLATAGADGRARLWDGATGLPIKPSFVHRGPVNSLAFHPDGKTLLTGSDDGTARLWDVPAPVEGEVERIDVWIHVLTGLEFDRFDAIQPMDIATWRDYRRRLNELDSSPEP